MDQISFYSAEASGPELADLAGVLCGQGQIVRLAKAWRAGDGKELPTGFRLTGGALRLWALAAGQPNGNHYLLAVDEDTPATHPVLAETCRQLGLPAQFVGPRAGGPAVRVTGKRRLATLEELIGTPARRSLGMAPGQAGNGSVRGAGLGRRQPGRYSWISLQRRHEVRR